MEKKLTNKRLVSRLMDMTLVDRIVVNDHAVTVRVKQSRVDQHRATANDFITIASKVGQEATAIPVKKDNKGQMELWIRFDRY